MIKSNTIQQAFNQAFKLATESKFESNSLKSSLFVHQVGEKIMENYNSQEYHLYCQKVDAENQIKIKGEWLLDAIIAKNHTVEERAVNNLIIRKNMISEVEWAIESEYATSLQAFLDDFSKLLIFNSKNKLYLNGYSSKNTISFENYKRGRLNTASDLIRKFDKIGNYYFCFWPSPEKKGNSSFWTKIEYENELISKIMTLHIWNKEEQCFSQ